MIDVANAFKGGVHVPDRKDGTKDKPIERMPQPASACICFSQHIGKPAVPCVKAGDRVNRGTLIGKADGAISANVFSSVSGVVKEIKKITEYNGAVNDYAVIENDGENSEEFLPSIGEITAESVKTRVFEAGLAGLGGAGFPTAVKLSPKEPIDALIINGAECEPYLTCDYRIMMEKTAELCDGIKLIALALGVKNIIVGIEDNKPEAIDKISAAADFTVVPLPKKYPQGGEKQIIYSCLGRKVRAGKLPSSVGVCVENVQTAYYVYQAVRNNMPLIERVITVGGDGVNDPKNLVCAIGTKYGDIIDFCGGLKENTVKFISGGPMMGRLTTTEAYTKKTDGGILALTSDVAFADKPTACISCDGCVDACPMRLMPLVIDFLAHTGDFDGAEKAGVNSCIECGCCSYVCPAKRDLVASMQLCKRKIKERGRK